MATFTTIDLGNNSWVKTCTDLPPEAQIDFEKVWALHPDEYGTVKIYGKTMSTPRWQQSYLKPYWFSGMTHPALPLPDELQPLFDWVNQMNSTVMHGGTCNQVLINWYADGDHYIGPHSDDESQLIPNSEIWSFSYGAERQFYIHPKGTDSTAATHKIPMPNNSVLIMGGEMQKHFKHSVPKSKKVTERRINITFRCFK